MTVRELKRQLECVNEDAIVYIGNPNHFGSDPQVAHEEAGVRYLVNGNEEVWFETYGGENIAEEVEAISEIADKEDWEEWEFYDQLFNPNKHSYTLEDIKRACPNRYENCKEYLGII